jgi:hypothetical protein
MGRPGRLFRVFSSSLCLGGIFAVSYCLFVFGSIAFVTGDGKAPQATHFAVWTMDFALSCLAIKDKSGAILPAMVFWSAGFTALVFGYKLIAMVIRGPGKHNPD